MKIGIDMRTLIIHPSDTTTDFLKICYADTGYSVIDTNCSKLILKEQIKNHDRIVMLGHGTEAGLLGYGRYIINSQLLYLLREKTCVCIWCNADKFFTKYNLHGFYTGMIISEKEEAEIYHVEASDDDISESNQMFAEYIRNVLIGNDDISSYISETNNVIKYNRNNIYKHDYVLVSDTLPEKGVDIIMVDTDNNKHHVFRCNCHNSKCNNYRCSGTGLELIIDPYKWISL